mgnify:CR=1 FL=1
MEYTKKDLLKMKKKLYNLVLMERRYTKFSALTNLLAIGSASGVAVSLCMYLEKLLDETKALTIGASCLTVTGLLAGAGYFVGKEARAISDDVFEFEEKCPEEVIEEVYDSVYKRR